MPGNLLFTDIAFPTVSGDDTKSDLKRVLNYLYMQNEMIRYTLGNLGTENFNDAELTDLTDLITGNLKITVQNVENSLAVIEGRADETEASIQLLAYYTGQSGYTTVTSAGQMTDTSKLYKMGSSYYRYNGTSWVETDVPISESVASVKATADANTSNITSLTSTVSGHTTSIASISSTTNANSSNISLVAAQTGAAAATAVTSTAQMTDTTKIYSYNGNYYRYNGSAWVTTSMESAASIIMTAINGSSTLQLSASRINFTGFSTFVRPSDLSSTGTTTIDGGRITTGTLSASKITTGTLSAGLIGANNGTNITFNAAISLSATYPDISGIDNLYFSNNNQISDTYSGLSGYMTLYSYTGIILYSQNTPIYKPSANTSYAMIHEGNISSYSMYAKFG